MPGQRPHNPAVCVRMCMCLSTHACQWVECINAYVIFSVSTCKNQCSWFCEYMWVITCVYIYMNVYTCEYIYMCACKCVFVNFYVCMCVSIVCKGSCASVHVGMWVDYVCMCNIYVSVLCINSCVSVYFLMWVEWLCENILYLYEFMYVSICWWVSWMCVHVSTHVYVLVSLITHPQWELVLPHKSCTMTSLLPDALC